jgi:antitoxin ParD1/3/4
MRASIHISLPDNLKDFVQQQVREKGYGTASEYVRDVLRKEQEQRVRTAVDVRLTDALATPALPLTAETWQTIRREGLKRVGQRRRQP